MGNHSAFERGLEGEKRESSMHPVSIFGGQKVDGWRKEVVLGPGEVQG